MARESAGRELTTKLNTEIALNKAGGLHYHHHSHLPKASLNEVFIALTIVMLSLLEGITKDMSIIKITNIYS